MHDPIPLRPVRRAALLLAGAAAASLLAGCGTGGTPWGATPTRIEIPVPDLRKVPEVWDGASGSTAGAQRVADRVRAALSAQPVLAGSSIAVEGYEGGLIILSGRLANPSDRALATQTARNVTGVRDVVDRMTAP
ncbi:BON domain-containing protein [Ottowia sp.]|uniref:BON domain-containing protein n=1 Tax=Ottowia sp. TaxID=1898956 RepID=UPI002B781380|nr:BON domain-containing protein [Ottowia sp.]HOB66814.1 BON domain-containing protein [Ottowia sp.]HPZ55819.1 BON domain-containing protein [Ottowia sp.]HQD48011.1 BON domain-containing protein [Ottowia sp.]